MRNIINIHKSTLAGIANDGVESIDKSIKIDCGVNGICSVAVNLINPA